MADASSDTLNLTGRTVGDFSVLRKLGAGGMGQVYLARQLSLKRDVALKFLNDDLVNNEKALKRFQAEAEAVARINHPNIVQVYAIGEADGQRYMALEFVNGRNLRDYLNKKGPPELNIALAILKQVASALQKANELGIVHRDVKPENILMTRKVEVKVTDFGLSRLTDATAVPLNLTQSGVTLGTPLYMAPEQVQGKPTDHRSDLYSFGVTAYHLLAGQPPFQGKTAYEVAMKHCTENPEPLAGLRPDLPADLIGLVNKLMAKNPEERYGSAKDVSRDLARIAKGLSTGTTPAVSLSMTTSTPFGPAPSGPTMELRKPSPWKWVLLAGLAIVSLAGVYGLGWWLFSRVGSGEVAQNDDQRPENGEATHSGKGLATAALPDGLKPQTGRERELISKLENRATSSEEIVNAAIDLGLLYLKERRLEKAKKVFEDLGKERSESRPLPKGLIGPPPQLVTAGFGQAIVLAHQDKVTDSLGKFEEVVKLAPRGPGFDQMRQFLIRHPDFSQAIAEALHRNQENLNQPAFKGQTIPQSLFWLRSPEELLRGGK